MFGDPVKLRELAEELAELSLAERRQYLAQIEASNGIAAAEQIKEELKRLWAEKR